MDVRKMRMKNGLVVITEAMPHLRSVSIGVWVRGGSRFEKKDTPGISHFIEHLLFKGTQSRSAEDIAEAIDSVGGQLDAFTDKEFVGFYAKVVDEHMPLALELLSDIVLNPTFPPEEMERERNVIFEEINMLEDSPQDLIHDLFMKSFWKGHPLGSPISGSKESVARITREEVLRHFRKSYTAGNMVISVAGNVRHREVRRLVARHFAGLEPGDRPDPGPPPCVHPTRVVRQKPNLEQTHICLGSPCPSVNSADRYTVHILNHVLGGGISSRLFQNIREKRGLVYSIYSSPNLYRDGGTLLVYAGAAPQQALSVVGLIVEELKRLREQLISAEELRRAKENIKGSLMLSLESSSSRMTHLAQQEIYFDRFYTLEEILDGYSRVRARDVRRLANEIFDSSSLALAALASTNGKELKAVALRV
jgi:predicted Zn-dependent peptidase